MKFVAVVSWILYLGLLVDSESSPEYNLVDVLLKKYDKHVRPIKDHGEITEVYVELSLLNVLNLNTKQQELVTNCELIMKWNDAYLIWNPDNHANISVIRLPYRDIWYPDVILYNTARPKYKESILNTNAIITHSGLVELISHAHLSSVCNIDIQWYPFDQQDCVMTFASWTYDNTQIVLKKGRADMSEYKENPEYFLENFYAVKNDLFNPCCEHSMSTLKYHVQLQRRAKFSVFFFIMPGVFINLCAIFIFSLPAESSEKMVLGISAMLAMIVFMMEMTLYLPPTEKIPLAGLYYGICLAMVAGNISVSILIMQLNVLGIAHYQVPIWARTLTINSVKYMKNKVPEVVAEKWGVYNHNGNQTIDRSFHKLRKVSAITLLKKENDVPQGQYKGPNQFKSNFESRMVTSLETIVNQMTTGKRNDDRHREAKTLITEWKFISRVLDRFFFYFFLIFIFLLNSLLLTSSPFSENFEYCPIEASKCRNMTMKEIMDFVHEGGGHNI